jgi:hypothetical protein
MKKKWLKIAVIGATIGIMSGQASAAGIFDLLTGLANAGCVKDNPNSFGCQFKGWVKVGTDAKTAYEKVQGVINGSPEDLAIIGATLFFQPDSMKTLTEQFNKIGQSGTIEKTVEAAQTLGTTLDNMKKGSIEGIVSESDKKLKELENKIKDLEKGIIPNFKLPNGIIEAQNNANEFTVASGNVTDAIVVATNTATSKKVVQNETITQAAQVYSNGDFDIIIGNAATQTETAADIATARIEESDNAVSTRAAIQITNKILADAMTLQADQQANLIDALQKSVKVQASTVLQLSTLVNDKLAETAGNQTSANIELKQSVLDGQNAVLLNQETLNGLANAIQSSYLNDSTTLDTTPDLSLVTPTTPK